MDRTPAEGTSADVAVAYRRPSVALPGPGTSPDDGTTSSTWFGDRVAADGDATADGPPDASAEPAPQSETRPEPEYGPAPPAGAGRTSFGFTAGPISPARARTGAPGPWDTAPASMPSAGRPPAPLATESSPWAPVSPQVRRTPADPDPQRASTAPASPVAPAVPSEYSGLSGPSGLRWPDNAAGSGAHRQQARAEPAPPEPAKKPREADRLPPPPPQSRFVTVGMVMLSVIVLVAGTVIGIVYFSGGDVKINQVLKLGASSGDAGRTVTAPLDGRRTASFDMVAGVDTVHVTIGDLDDDLYRISTPDDAGIKPSPVVHDDSVELQVTKDGDGDGGEIDVVLSSQVRWDLRFSGYANDQEIDLTDGDVSGIEMVAGMHKASLSLPQPNGTVPVKITGAVEQLQVTAPEGSPVRVKVGAGISTVVAGARTLRNVEAGSTITPRNWSAANRYDVTTASAITSMNVGNAN